MNIAANSTKGNNSGVKDLSILDMAHLLERNPKERSKFVCPVCGGHNLSINARTGEYDCYDDPTPQHRSEIFTTLLKQFRPIDGWTDLQRAEHQSTRTKAKVKKKQQDAVKMREELNRGKVYDPDFTNPDSAWVGFETAARIEMKVAAIAETYDPKIPTRSELKLINELESWCIESKIPHYNPVRMLKEAIAARTNAVPDIEDDSEDYKRAIGRTQAGIDFDTLLNPKLSRLIRATAATLPVNPEMTYLHYRSVMSSIVGTRAKLVIRPGWTQGMTCWTMGIADPGARKSANLDKLIAPLTTLQDESKKAHEQAMKEYDALYRIWLKEVKENPQLEEPAKPTQREWFVVDATMESLAPMLDKSPYAGVVSVHDELGSWFDKMDAYRNGGGDRANWLSLINGGSLKVNRKDVTKNIFVKKTAVSITGSTQPETLDRMMRESKDTNDGLWDRFRIATGRFVSIRDRGQAFDSDPHFLQLYRNLDAMPERVYQLSPAAERLFFEFECWIEDQRCQVSKRFYSALNKMQWKLAVETLALHLEDAAIEGNISPSAQIPKSTVERALVAINYDILQMRVLHDRMVEQVLDAKILGAIELCKKGDGTITPRQMIHTRLVKNAAEGHALIDQMIGKFLGVEDEELSTARKRVFRYVDGGIVSEADGFVVPESEAVEEPAPQFEVEAIAPTEPEPEVEITWEEEAQPVAQDAPPSEEPTIEGFQVGDRVEVVFPEHFDKATRKESARNNEAPYGQQGEIEEIVWVKNRLTLKWDARAIVKIDSGESCRLFASYLKLLAIA